MSLAGWEDERTAADAETGVNDRNIGVPGDQAACLHRDIIRARGALVVDPVHCQPVAACLCREGTDR